WGLVAPHHFVLSCPSMEGAMPQKRKPTDTVQLKLRFPEALRRRLVREAERQALSLNSYIVRTLENAFLAADDVNTRARAIAESLGDEIVEAIVEQANRAAAEDELGDYQKEEMQIAEREGK